MALWLIENVHARNPTTPRLKMVGKNQNMEGRRRIFIKNDLQTAISLRFRSWFGVTKICLDFFFFSVAITTYLPSTFPCHNFCPHLKPVLAPARPFLNRSSTDFFCWNSGTFPRLRDKHEHKIMSPLSSFMFLFINRRGLLKYVVKGKN